ncbi:MAG: PAS domain S-box protein, partial [Opitutus sp.]
MPSDELPPAARTTFRGRTPSQTVESRRQNSLSEWHGDGSQVAACRTTPSGGISPRRLGPRISLALALLASLALCSTLYFYEARQAERQLREREIARTSLLSYFFRYELRPVANDVRVLAEGDGLRDYLRTGSGADLERVIRRAVLFSRQRSTYDQIRFIDTHGQERVRVNQGGIVVAPTDLANKADRPYFQKANALEPEQIFISAFDLNEEHGTVEAPSKPMLRFATPVFDEAGQRRGIYVINFLASALIADLERATPAFAHRLRLLDAKGHWMKSAKPAEDWGAVLPGRSQFAVSSTNPELWAQLSREPKGQARLSGGLFTWHRVSTVEFGGESLAMTVTEEPYVLLASQVSAQEWSSLFTGLRVIFALVTPGLLGLVLLTAWFFRARERAVLALRRSEEDLAVTLQSIGDAVMATDTAGRVIRMNGISEKLTGWSQAEALGRPVDDVFRIIHEETRQPALIPVKDVLATGETRALANHTLLMARDGTEHAIADSAAPIRDRQDQIVGVVLVFRDVSAERVSEQKLADALRNLSREQARLQRVFDLVPVGISFVITEANGRRSRLINNAHLRLCGFTRDQVEEPGIFARITHPDDREPQALRVRQLEQGTINRYEIDKRYLRPDGSTVWVQLYFQRQKFSDGSQEDLSIVVDITDRKEADEKIRRHNAQLTALFESLPGLYLVLTPGLKIVTASEAFLAATMTERNSIIGRGVFEVFPDNPADASANGVANWKSSIERVLRTHKSDTMAIQRYDVRGPDGIFVERYWSPINSPMLGLHREVEFVIHRVEDVTDFVRQKQTADHGADRELKARMTKMEAEIFQSSQKVQFANQQLHAANRELEAFSYSVSHDLRAPLRHIQGYVAMLGRETPDLSEKGRRFLNTIAEAGREMGELIDNLLAFSRMGRVEMREAEVDLAAVVEQARYEAARACPEREITWKIAPLPPVHGDQAMLRQVFANLLGNAVKYSRGRSPAEIEVGCAGEENG